MKPKFLISNKDSSGDNAFGSQKGKTQNSTIISAEKEEKKYYCKIENMNNYINENFIKFRENFELLDFISYGGT
jgi:hypothetical protein